MNIWHECAQYIHIYDHICILNIQLYNYIRHICDMIGVPHPPAPVDLQRLCKNDAFSVTTLTSVKSVNLPLSMPLGQPLKQRN